jgi:hypothetical protein
MPLRLFAASLTGFIFLALGPSANAEIEWEIAPYIWAADVGLDTTINGDPVLGVTVPFSDLVDKLDSAFMIHGEGISDSGFGGFADIITLTVSDSSVTPVGPGGPILGDLAVNTEISVGMYEAGGILRFGDAGIDKTVMDILLGLRYVDIDQDLAITLPGPAGNVINRNISVSEVDALIGVRVVGQFSQRLGYQVRGDYADLGTEGSWNLLATLGYTFGEGLFTLDVGYRHMMLDLADNLNTGGNSSSDLDMSGPLVGFVFRF